MAPVSSTALCPLYGPLKNSKKSETTSLASQNVLQNAFHKNSKGFVIYFIIAINAIIAIIMIITQAKYAAIIGK
jgi:hypothetical protein